MNIFQFNTFLSQSLSPIFLQNLVEFEINLMGCGRALKRTSAPELVLGSKIGQMKKLQKLSINLSKFFAKALLSPLLNPCRDPKSDCH